MFAAADMSMPSKLLLHYGTVGLIACGMSISGSLVCVRIANFKEFDLKLKLFVAWKSIEYQDSDLTLAKMPAISGLPDACELSMLCRHFWVKYVGCN